MSSKKWFFIILYLLIFLAGCKETTYIPITKINNITNNITNNSSVLWYNNSGITTTKGNKDVKIIGSLSVLGTNTYLTNLYVSSGLYGDLGILDVRDTVNYHNNIIYGVSSFTAQQGTFTNNVGSPKVCDTDDSICLNETQKRVSGTCSAGSSIRVIASDGSVTCESDSTGDNYYVTGISVSENGNEQNISLTRNGGLSTLWATFYDNNSGSTSSGLWWNDSNVATYNGSVHVEGLNNSGNSISTYLSYPTVTVSNTGLATSISAYGECLYSSTGSAFICDPPYNIYGAVTTINNTGYANTINLEGGLSSVSYDNKITGNANYLGGYNDQGNTIISGNGNIVSGSGGFNVSGNGNLVTGTQNTVSAKNAITAGQLLETIGNFCTNLGAQNKCSGAYGTSIGYANKVYSGTGTAIGAYNYLGFSGTRTVILGNNVNFTKADSVGVGINIKETRSNILTLGNGNTGNNNRDLSISKTNITINKSTLYIASLNTGANAGTNLCIDANNQLCACGSCA